MNLKFFFDKFPLFYYHDLFICQNLFGLFLSAAACGHGPLLPGGI